MLRLGRGSGGRGEREGGGGGGGRISIRDSLLVSEVAELDGPAVPATCALHFPSPAALHSFHLTVRPDDGPYQGGAFTFQIDVPPEYNNEVLPFFSLFMSRSKVVCLKAASRQVPHAPLAPQHNGGGRSLPQPPPPHLHRRPGFHLPSLEGRDER